MTTKHLTVHRLFDLKGKNTFELFPTFRKQSKRPGVSISWLWFYIVIGYNINKDRAQLKGKIIVW